MAQDLLDHSFFLLVWAASTQLACKQFEPEQFKALLDSHYMPTTSLPSIGPVISPREDQRERATEGNRVQWLSDAGRAHGWDRSVKAYFVILCIDYMHSMKYDGKSTSKREAGTARAHFLLTVYSSNSSNTLWKWQRLLTHPSLSLGSFYSTCLQAIWVRAV